MRLRPNETAAAAQNPMVQKEVPSLETGRILRRSWCRNISQGTNTIQYWIVPALMMLELCGAGSTCQIFGELGANRREEDSDKKKRQD